MGFIDFLKEHKKIVFIVVIIICAFLIGVISTKFLGGIAGLFGLIWGMIVGKKDKRTKEHEEKIEKINKEIENVRKEEEITFNEIRSLKEEETKIREDINKTKERLKKMSLKDKIDEHNKILGITQ